MDKLDVLICISLEARVTDGSGETYLDNQCSAPPSSSSFLWSTTFASAISPANETKGKHKRESKTKKKTNLMKLKMFLI